MTNINARLDHIIDRFKHDIRDLIEIAVKEEHAEIMERLDNFVSNTKAVTKKPKLSEGALVSGGKVVGEKVGVPVIITPVPLSKPETESVIEALAERPPTNLCGFCKRRGSPCVRHGGSPSQLCYLLK
jgi:hypothetical protein